MFHTLKPYHLIFVFLLVGMTVLRVSLALAQTATPASKSAIASKTPHAANPISIKKMCTQAAKADWLNEDEFLILMKHRGYTIQSFKVVYESCYEVYGFDKDKQIVEAYFNPQNAKLNRQNFVKN